MSKKRTWTHWVLKDNCPDPYLPKLIKNWAVMSYLSKVCIDDIFAAPPYMEQCNYWYVESNYEMTMFIGGIEL